MILPWIIILFVAGALLAWISERFGREVPRWVSLFLLLGHMGFLIYLWVRHARVIEHTDLGPWMFQFDAPWIPSFGIRFHLGLDGLSLMLVSLSNFLAVMAVATSWNVIRKRIGFFHFNLLLTLAALIGVFTALDLFLFYFSWEILIVPLFFLIAIWGHEARRSYAAVKFFIFTQASGLLMLLAILGLYFVHGRDTGRYTFDFFELLGTNLPPSVGGWLMLGFFAAFAVKLPVVPVHVWLPDAHTEAPTAGSVYLAGLVLKVGAYGMLRFVIPLFPDASAAFAPAAMTLGVIGIVYGAVAAFSQTDLKRLVAYTSISHMGFVLLGIFAWNPLALQGAFMIMLAHGISTSALFMLAGDLYERIHTRDLGRMGGLWSKIPRMGGVGLLFVLASLGLPGLANFTGEFLVLLGAFKVSVPLAVLASSGFVLSTVYSLWIMQRVFHGPPREDAAAGEGRRLRDMTSREAAIMAPMAALILWMGIYPQNVFNTARKGLESLQSRAAVSFDAGETSPWGKAPPKEAEGSDLEKPHKGDAE